MRYPFPRSSYAMEQKLEQLIEAQAGLQNQLAAVNETLLTLPQNLTTVMVGSRNSTNTKDTSTDDRQHQNEIVNPEHVPQNDKSRTLQIPSSLTLHIHGIKCIAIKPFEVVTGLLKFIFLFTNRINEH